MTNYEISLSLCGLETKHAKVPRSKRAKLCCRRPTYRYKEVDGKQIGGGGGGNRAVWCTFKKHKRISPPLRRFDCDENKVGGVGDGCTKRIPTFGRQHNTALYMCTHPARVGCCRHGRERRARTHTHKHAHTRTTLSGDKLPVCACV